jgi:alkanesulfonate monooxygenase SsuD/methylene tetrahydromethanopterin reductase-like flavin-dependent oxidoreductase (luciferase family)
MLDAVRFGVVILPEHPWPAAQALWQRAEALGFDHAWTYDHLAWRSLRDSAWFGAVPTLTAAALATTRIRLGPLVASPTFRHPVPFAKELMTLDDVSGGRLTVGIGAGGTGWDATMLGTAPWSALERAERFAEFVEVTDRLLREPEVSFRGTYYAADEARMHPGCVQRPRPPFAVAATGPRAMRVAASYGQAWVTTGDRDVAEPSPPEAGVRAVSEQIARLDETCVAVGRDPGSLDRMVLTGPALDPGLHSVEAFRDTVGRYAAAGVTDFVVHWPRPDPPYDIDLAIFERIFSAR